MQLGLIGLGRMGANMARRLINDKHEVYVFNRTAEKTKELAAEGAFAAYSLIELIKSLKAPRVVLMMLPAGDVVENQISALVPLMEKGDILIDGGNSHYKDDIRRCEKLKASGIIYMDAGVSGGIVGLKDGYAVMAGGTKDAFLHVEPAFKSLAPAGGYMHCGPSGAGHFVKMIHNAIEYGMMESYGEGFELLKASVYGDSLDMQSVAKMWNAGSVVKSWLLERLIGVFNDPSALDKIEGYVEDSGEARWAVQEAVDLGVAADVITTSLYKRFNSRQEEVYSNRLLAALRREFGGHLAVKNNEKVRIDSAGAGRVEHAAADREKK
jgi:6-phosphogluconate dehydrogenase